MSGAPVFCEVAGEGAAEEGGAAGGAALDDGAELLFGSVELLKELFNAGNDAFLLNPRRKWHRIDVNKFRSRTHERTTHTGYIGKQIFSENRRLKISHQIICEDIRISDDGPFS